MTVACPSCRRPITVPPDKVATPNLKARCRCGHVFVVLEAAGGAAPVRVAAAAAAPPPRPAPGPGSVPTAVVAGALEAATPLPKIQPPASPKVRPPVPPPVPPAVAPVARPGAPVHWKRCANHRQSPSVHVCPQCQKGYCDACTQKVQTAAICPGCEGLCVTTVVHAETQDRAQARSRSMMDDIGVIARYPLGDPVAYVMLALFTWFFGLFSSMAIMYVLSKGVLVWYCFNAVSKVAIGNLRTFMPDGDISDIFRALRLSFAALVIAAGPLVLCAILIPGVSLLMGGRSIVDAPRLEAAHAQPLEPPAPEAVDDDEPGEASPAAGEEPGAPPEMDEPAPTLGLVWVLAVVAAFVWWILYAPVALVVAALSKSVLSTLNPLIGVDTIRKMGSTYWQALAIYLVIVIAQTVAGFALDQVPLAGSLLRSFVDAYGYPTVGCTLGLAVFKKAAELGWD